MSAGPGRFGVVTFAGARSALPAAGLRAVDPRRLGLWVFLATVTMLFAAFSSAYLVRMASGGWNAVDLPGVLWLTTSILLLSSATLEVARLRVARARAARRAVVAPWLLATLGLGVLFLAGQLAAWRALQTAGVFLPNSPHAAFLYIFMALHGVHLLGGLVWLGALSGGALSGGARVGRNGELEDQVARCSTYWHFMAGLWVFLFAVLHLG